MFLADAGSSFDLANIASFAQFGVVGVVLICIITGKWLITRRELDRADVEHAKELAARDADIKELKESNAALRTLTEQQIIPALVRANQLSADYAQDLAAERRRRRDGPEDY